MHKRFVPFLIVFSLAVAPAYGQGFEFTPYIGWTWSEGVETNGQEIGGVTFDKITPVSGANWGMQFDVLFGEHGAIGFNFADQASKLEASVRGSGKEEFTDMRVRNYHAVFTYNMGDSDASARGYFFGGIGATQYSPSDIMGTSVDGATKFSTTWGGGIKAYFNDNFGFRAGARWTPTYIKSDPGGLWCSPYWPGACWILADDKYSHQFEVSAGLIVRFGAN